MANPPTNRPTNLLPGKFWFVSTAARLQDLALIQVCKAIWHHAIVTDQPWHSKINEQLANLVMSKDKTILDTFPQIRDTLKVAGRNAAIAPWEQCGSIYFMMRRIKQYTIDENNPTINASIEARIPVEVQMHVSTDDGHRRGRTIKLQPQVRRMTRKMGELLYKWIQRHIVIFLDLSVFRIIFTEYFDDFVWECGGIIDLHYELTAAKLARRDRLSAADTFCLTSEYCLRKAALKAYVRAMRDLHPVLRTSFRETSQNEIQWYWLHVFSGRMNKNQRMFLSDEVTVSNILTLEYFWKLNEKTKGNRVERLPMNLSAISIIRMNAMTLRYFLTRLNDNHWKLLMKEHAARVIYELMKIDTKSKYAVQVWTAFIKDIPYLQFYLLFRRLLKYKRLFTPHDILIDDDMQSTFLLIWRNTPSQWKKQAIYSVIYSFELFEYPVKKLSLRNFPRSMKILNAMVSQADTRIKGEIWRNNWPNLIGGTDPNCLRNLMSACIGEQNVFEFKEVFMSYFPYIKDYCIALMKCGCYNELDEFLKFVCSHDQEKIGEIKREISKVWKDFIHGSSHANDLDRLD